MLTVRLVATVHCDHRHPDFTRCPRMDEHDERPVAGASAIGFYTTDARAAFKARGWRFTAAGEAYCSDHVPKPKETK